MTSFLKPPQKVPTSSGSPSSRSPPPTSFKPDITNGIATRRPRETLSPGSETAKLAHRNSRVDLDFEQALASHDTFRLQEGPDISTMGQEAESPPIRSHYPNDSGEHTSLTLSQMLSGGIGGDSSKPSSSTRRLKKAHHSSTPSTSPIPNPMSPTSTAANAMIRPSTANSSRPSLSEYSSVSGSPTPSNRELPDEQGSAVKPGETNYPSRGQGEVKKRGMFRSAGTASSPDLGTMVRKKKDQRGPPPKVPNLPQQNNDYDEGVYPSTDAPPSSMSGWTATLSGRNRSSSKGEGKSPRTLRAKTGTFLSNIFSSSPSTVRERPRAATGDSSHPSTPHRTRYDRPFEDSPPVPAIPHEHRSGPTNIADMFAPSSATSGTASSSKAGRRTSKPLPPIVRPSTGDKPKQRHHQHEMTVSPVDTATSESGAGSSPLHASPHVASAFPSTPQKRPAEVISRIQSNSSARRRRSMSVGDAEQWNKTLSGPMSPSKVTKPAREPSPQPKISAPLDQLEERRPISSTSTSSGYTTARSEASTTRSMGTTPLASPIRDTPTVIPPTREWERALAGWDQVTSLEIKDPTTMPNNVTPTKVRPRSKTQDPMPIPPRLSLGKPSGTIRAGSLGSPPAGFSLPAESSSSSLNFQKKSPSLYATPPSGPPSTSTSFSSMQATPTRRGSVSPTVPFTGPVIIGTTPATIGHTTTKVTIQRDEPQMTPVNSPRPSTSPPASASPNSSPMTPHSAVYSQNQRRSSSSHRSASPQLQPPNPLSQVSSGRASTSLRVSSLRGQARPTINILGTPSAPSPSAAGVLRNAPSTGLLGQTSPKISLSFTSPSQENLRFAGASTGGSYGGARAHELRMYGMKNPASSSEPTLLPPWSVGVNGTPADDSIRTIRLITSGSRLGGAMRNDNIVTESGEVFSSTRISSPTSSVKHTFSNASTGTSVGRSSVSRDGSAGTINGSGSLLNLEEMESKAEAIAQRIWEEDETFKSKERFSEWLGQPDALNAVARRYYMDHFDFTNLRVDLAFRRLCTKLFLRAESQALDRILIEFSRRYWEHNPNCILGSASNVHQVVYSLLLLNTDLHVADLAHHMTKQQFIANTLSTLSGPSRTSSSAPTPARSSSPLQDSDSMRKASLDPLTNASEKSEKSGPPVSIQNPTLRVKRSGSITSGKGSLSREGTKDSISSTTTSGNQSGPGQYSMQSAPFNSPSGIATESSSLNGSTVSFHENPGRKHTSGQASVTSLPTIGQKAWENDIEAYLKDIYGAIRSSQILQPQGTGGGLSPGSSLGRGSSQRRNGTNMNTLKRNSMRGIPSFINAQQGVNGSSSSIDGRLSPSPSFATSLNDGTATSSSALFAPALGFASNLSNTIIREAQEDDQRSLNSDVSDSTDVSISDEELALLGAPWAKEGVLHRKQYWESAGKRSKNKNWMEVFVVIQKGQMNMFVFGANSSGGGGSNSGVVGGGNWLSNAQNVGEHMLAHSLAHVLPPPGLARRPHCFVLTLASGMGFFFQAGTEELANEWVSTCNYWAARQSKEPLAGGVSNMEYGWSRVEPEALAAADDYDGPPESIRGLSMRDSTDNFSLRSGKSRMGARFDGFSTMRSNPFADRIYINDWRAPGHSMVASNHDEETQLEALQRQAEKLKTEFKKHNDLRDPMIALYAPKSSNLAKAMINWESRSQYLHTEIVKYEKYVESLKGAMKERLRRRGEKALERALLSSSEITPGPNQRGFGFSDEEAIPEDQETETEALTPGADRVQFKANPVQNQQHKRNAAETAS